MNLTKTKLWALPLVVLVVCSSYSDKRVQAIPFFPELGSIVAKKARGWHTTKEPIGIPVWETPLKVVVTERPFSKASYQKYVRHTEKTGQQNTITYHDSLAVAPTHLHLQLVDKIGLTQQLNRDSNQELRDYIANNPNAKLVTAIDGVVADTLRPVFQNARFVLLTQGPYKHMQLLLKGEKQEHSVYLNAITVFDSTTSSFCWGEDRYGTLRIDQLVPKGQNCPKGTSTKASKIHKRNASLKI